jgi:lipopolysaccharide export system permease protein
MGKGLEISIIIELIFYVSAVLIPLALPLAVLLSSIMSMGNLAENNELTALKAAGLPLYRVMRPLFYFMIVISFITFYCSNYVIPIANLKMRSLIYDIQQTKIASIATPGTFSKEITGYSIKVDKAKGSKFKGITIYDKTNENSMRSIKADSAEAFKSTKGDFLFFKLFNGYMNEEINNARNEEQFHPARKSHFKTATFKLDLSGFKLERTDEDLFENQYEMMNIFQLYSSTDSVVKQYYDQSKSFAEMFADKGTYLYCVKSYNSFKVQKNNAKQAKKVVPVEQFKMIAPDKLHDVYENAISKLRNYKNEVNAQHSILAIFLKNLTRIKTELNKKFALCVSVIVLFFIGAPLGAIVKKGGFGAPVVIAVFLFMVYYIITITGENMVETETISPWLGIWLSTFILSPIAFYLNWRSNNDLPLFSFEKLSHLKKLILRK